MYDFNFYEKTWKTYGVVRQIILLLCFQCYKPYSAHRVIKAELEFWQTFFPNDSCKVTHPLRILMNENKNIYFEFFHNS